MAKRKKAAPRKKQTRRTGRPRRNQRTRLTAALERAQKTLTREVLSTALADLPSRTTMGEVVSSLRSAGFSKDFSAMSLRDFMTAVSGGEGASKASGGSRKAGRRKSATRASRTKKVNTRTAGGREALDKAISEFLAASKTARAEEVRKAVGGTSAQVRQSLSRLMAAKKVSKKGEKRGTEYSWGRGRAKG